MSVPSLVMKSSVLDVRLAIMSELTVDARVRFLWGKWRALAFIAAGKSAMLAVGSARLRVKTIGDVGTTQSCVIDVYDELMNPRLIGTTPTIIDVGANIGQWTSAVKWFVPGSRILAIEADPRTCERLAANLATLDSVSWINAAVDAKVGTGVLYRQRLSGMSTLYPSSGDERNNTIEVIITTLDSMLGGYAEIDVLKIDVEGAELGVLKGAVDTLSRVRYLVVETSLSRGVINALDVFAYVKRIRPGARIVKHGRPLGERHLPACQDVVIEMA